MEVSIFQHLHIITKEKLTSFMMNRADQENKSHKLGQQLAPKKKTL
jgi:hypothetical protein